MGEHGDDRAAAPLAPRRSVRAPPRAGGAAAAALAGEAAEDDSVGAAALALSTSTLHGVRVHTVSDRTSRWLLVLPSTL